MKKKIIPYILIAVGLAIMAYPKVNEAYRDYQQQRLIAQWQESLAAIDQGEEDDSTLDEERKAREQEEEERQERERLEKERKAREDYIKSNMDGMMTIDRINLHLPVLKGASVANLNLAPASLDKTGKIGEIGNYAVAGHRSHTYGRNFNRLDEVEPGDTILMEDGENKYEYRVEEKIYVEPAETWVLNSTERDREITLITCHPFKNPTHRLIVKGRIIDRENGILDLESTERNGSQSEK